MYFNGLQHHYSTPAKAFDVRKWGQFACGHAKLSNINPSSQIRFSSHGRRIFVVDCSQSKGVDMGTSLGLCGSDGKRTRSVFPGRLFWGVYHAHHLSYSTGAQQYIQHIYSIGTNTAFMERGMKHYHTSISKVLDTRPTISRRTASKMDLSRYILVNCPVW